MSVTEVSAVEAHIHRELRGRGLRGGGGAASTGLSVPTDRKAVLTHRAARSFLPEGGQGTGQVEQVLGGPNGSLQMDVNLVFLEIKALEPGGRTERPRIQGV